MCTSPETTLRLDVAIKNAARWMVEINRAQQVRDEPCPTLEAWNDYLQVVSLNCLMNASCAGLAPPLVPLEAALGPQEDPMPTCPPTPGPGPVPS